MAPIIEKFKKELQKKIDKFITIRHPLFRELATSKNKELLKTASLEGYHLVKIFPKYIAALLHNCPLDEFRPMLATNLYEEETGGISKTSSHLVLMKNFLKSLDISDKQIDQASPLATTKDLIDYRWNLVINPQTFHLGAAAITIASEGQNLEKRDGKFKHEILQGVYGLNENDTKFFSMHIEEDKEHVDEGIQIVAASCKDLKMQQDALRVIDETRDKFWNFYSGVYEYYQAKVKKSA